jgi:cyclophilin family peptidyl-prolyl cis-trans isomerase
MFGSKKKEVDEAAAGFDFAKHRYQLELDTTHGKITLDFWPDVAPSHCRNMLGLAKIGYYNDLSFHRIVPGFVIQGGCPNGNGTGGPGYKIDAEFNTNKHDPGVLSMARSSDPNSAGSQFFLCLAKVPYLDGQYTGFGKTADEASLKVVQAIGEVATGAQDRPIEPVTIKSAKVVELPL